MFDQNNPREGAQPEQEQRGINPFHPQLYLGVVSQATASQVTVSFPNIAGDANGQAAPGARLAEVGGFVLIAAGPFAVFGQLTDIRVPESQRVEFDPHTGLPLKMCPVGKVQISNSLDLETGKTVRGVPSMPRIGSRVFVADPRLVQRMAESRGDGQGPAVELSFARLPDARKTPLSFSPEMIFGRHCALLGTTGGGKSWSLARLVEECAKLRSKTIVFDATGEFSTLGGPVRHVYLGSDPEPPSHSREVALPYFELTERDLFAIFRPKGQSQAPKLRAAIKSLKLAQLSPDLAMDGTILKSHRSKSQFNQAYREFYHQVEDPKANFDVKMLARQIENECVRPNRSALEPQFWGEISGTDQALCVSLVNRVSDIVQSPNLAPIFEPHGKASLLREIDTFLADSEVRALVISLKYLSFAHHAREIIANATGRHLLRLAREDAFRKNPLLVVVDEAHQFLNKALVNPDAEYPLDSFSIIAKEGRKYALSICLATQRPRDIPEDVLSQMGTMIIHRLINDQDRGMVERACGELDRTALNALPTLAPGEAIVLGVSFPVPLIVKVEAPKAPPHSTGPDFQRYWQ